MPEIKFEDVIGCLGKVNELQSDMVGISIGIKTNEGPSEVFKNAIDWASARKWSKHGHYSNTRRQTKQNTNSG